VRVLDLTHGQGELRPETVVVGGRKKEGGPKAGRNLTLSKYNFVLFRADIGCESERRTERREKGLPR